MDINNVVIVGRLGRDPELKYNGNGHAYGKLAIATTRRFKDKDSGQMQETTDWHQVIVNGKDAENAGQYLVKGQEVGITGYLTTRKYNKDGQDVYVTEVRATSVSYGSKPNGAGKPDAAGDSRASAPASRPPQGGSKGAPAASSKGSGQGQSRPAPTNFDDFGSDDIPF